ncbi:hypothetical protein GWK26_12720 [haloarchaeon 3A1-DGR]|nr:hypothetical protein GWK26_12720 [haloarchaeon 3A1-DGR]
MSDDQIQDLEEFNNALDENREQIKRLVKWECELAAEIHTELEEDSEITAQMGTDQVLQKVDDVVIPALKGKFGDILDDFLPFMNDGSDNSSQVTEDSLNEYIERGSK